MKNLIIKLLVCLTMAFVSIATTPYLLGQSLQDKCNECPTNYKLWDAMEIVIFEGHMTAEQFRIEARAYGKLLGIPYDESGKNNIEILYADIRTPLLEVLESTSETTLVDTMGIESTATNKVADTVYITQIDTIFTPSDTITRTIVVRDTVNMPLIESLRGIEIPGPYSCGNVEFVSDIKGADNSQCWLDLDQESRNKLRIGWTFFFDCHPSLKGYRGNCLKAQRWRTANRELWDYVVILPHGSKFKDYKEYYEKYNPLNLESPCSDTSEPITLQSPLSRPVKAKKKKPSYGGQVISTRMLKKKRKRKRGNCRIASIQKARG